MSQRPNKEATGCFSLEGCKSIVLGYKFGVDTGNTKPVCCKKMYMFY